MCVCVCVCECVRERVAAWKFLNTEELTGRADRSLPFRLGAWGEEVRWQRVGMWEGAVGEVLGGVEE